MFYEQSVQDLVATSHQKFGCMHVMLELSICFTLTVARYVVQVKSQRDVSDWVYSFGPDVWLLPRSLSWPADLRHRHCHTCAVATNSLRTMVEARISPAADAYGAILRPRYRSHQFGTEPVVPVRRGLCW